MIMLIFIFHFLFLEAHDPCILDKGTNIDIKFSKNDFLLVTGGAGFIGSTLVEYLIGLGARVRVLDNLVTGTASYLDGSNPQLEFMYGDIRRLSDCHKSMINITGVFHLAAMSKVLPSLDSPAMSDFCISNNVKGTNNILYAALQAKTVKKVVYAASSTAYGNLPPPHVETMLPDPQSPYAVSKYQGELLMKLFYDLYGLQTASLRFFMVYGPRQPHTGSYAIVTGIFMKALSKKEPLRIEGDGNQSRDFIHVADVARALVHAMHFNITGTINVGSGKAVSIKDIAEAIDKRGKRVYAPARKNDLWITLADTCKAKTFLRFSAEKEVLSEILRPSDMHYSSPVVSSEIVVARGRNEDIGWLSAFPNIRNVVYDKSNNDCNGHGYNIGGETTIYVRHIIRSFHNLPAVIIFSQGDPLNHVQSIEHLKCGVQWALQEQPPYVGLSKFSANEVDFAWHPSLNSSAASLLDALGLAKRNNSLPINFNGIFATTREAIHARGMAWWEKLWTRLTNIHNHAQDVIEGDHVIERYWAEILNGTHVSPACNVTALRHE